VTANPANDTTPSWLPGGHGLAFVSSRNGQPDIWWTRTLDERDATLLVPDARDPAVSPDGTRIAFVRAGPGGYSAWLLRRLPTHPVPVVDERPRRHVESPGAVLVARRPPDLLRGVERSLDRSRRGSRGRPLTSVEYDSHPAWSPDGRFVYFTTLTDQVVSRLWRVRPTGQSREP